MDGNPRPATPPTPGPGKPKVSVYVVSYNYARFLPEALDSVLSQSLPCWELILVDDGSTDATSQIIDRYRAAHPERIRVLRNETRRGLRACANQALEVARGDYVMRLDADDYLDDSALLVMADFLDRHPDVGLVYPNYTFVDEQGRFLGLENRKKVGTEAKLLDLPAHGACTMVRKRALKMIGGYDEQYDAQDGHELWLKLLHRLPVANVSTPLFAYRRHADSISQDENRLLSSRRLIKHGLAQRTSGPVRPRIVAVIPAKNSYPDMEDLVLRPLAGKVLIDHTLDAAAAAGVFDRIIVTTDDPAVVRHCNRRPGVLALLRPANLAHLHVRLSQVLHDAVTRVELEHDMFPDVVALLSSHSPLRTSDHIVEAVDTLMIHNVDNVVSVYEDHDLHFLHGENGLEAINKGLRVRIRLEREALYVDNGAINVMWRDAIRETDHYGARIGHTVMAREDSYGIRGPFDLWLVEQLLLRRQRGDQPALRLELPTSLHATPEQRHEVCNPHDRHQTPSLLRQPNGDQRADLRRARARKTKLVADVLEGCPPPPLALGVGG